MKKITLLLALLIPMSLMAQISFTDKNKVKRTYTKVVNSAITVNDGTKLNYSGSSAVTAAQVKALYDAQIKPPVVIPPIIPPSQSVDIYTPENLSKMVGLSNKKVKIKAGTYTDQYWLTNFNNVEIDLTDAIFSTKGMPVFELKGNVNGIYVKGGKFINTTHSAFKLRSTGSNITLDGLYFENSGPIFEGAGTNEDSGFKDVCSNFKLINSKAYNCPNVGTFVWIGAADNFLIQNNTFDRINANTDIHNGLIYVVGNGKIISNRLTNHQGNLARIQPMQILGIGKTVEIANNIVWNSRKYGAFEVQVYDYQRTKSFVAANVNIYNNTVGDLNTSKDWEAKLLDKYDTYGTITLKNNLGFNLVQSNGQLIISLFNNAGGEDGLTKVIEENSIYKNTALEAVNNLTDFNSKFVGVGAK